MRAIVQHGHGAPERALKLEEIEAPAPDDGEVLVRVRAASINIGDAHVVKGVPYVMRPLFRGMRAKNRVPGSDFAGVVETVGPGVTKLRAGDEVFGWGKGAFAEYVAVPGDNLALKPIGFSFEQAAALGVSAFTALQALRDQGQVEAGNSVLITGASGSVGTFAVQIAKTLDTEVTGVCSSRNVEMVRALGADHVIDYTVEDFTQGDRRFDFILDNVGNHSLRATRRVLRPNGKLLANGAHVSGWVGGLGRFAGALVQSLFVRGQLRSFVSVNNAGDLAALRELAESGEVTPVIDSTYSLADGVAAFSDVAKGHAQGKTVVTM